MNYTEMIRYIAGKTGLDQEKVELIIEAGEPWVEYNRFAGSFTEACKISDELGVDLTASLDTFTSLLELECELKEKDIEKDRIPEDCETFTEKVERVADIAKESPEMVKKVVRGMLDYFYDFIEKIRKVIGEKKR